MDLQKRKDLEIARKIELYLTHFIRDSPL